MRSQDISLGGFKNGKDACVPNSFIQDEEDHAQHGAHVEAKYMGTVVDQREMSVLGRTQVLRVWIHRTG